MNVKVNFVEEFDGIKEPGDLVNVEFDDPSDPTKDFCVGFTYRGGDMQLPENYAFDHANRWDKESVIDNAYTEISRNELENILHSYGTSIRAALSLCLQAYFNR